MTTEITTDDSFTLYDLRVEVVAGDGPVVTHAKPGEYFDVIGGRIVFPGEPSFSLYGMMAVLPFLPAKQRASVNGGGNMYRRGGAKMYHGLGGSLSA